MTVLLIFASRPAQTKTSVTWHIDQCRFQELELSSSSGGMSMAWSSGRALKEFGPNTFEVMQEIIARRNTSLQHSASSAGSPGSRWVLHEVLHGCLGAARGNTFSFSIKLESTGAGMRDDKAVLPGY